MEKQENLPTGFISEFIPSNGIILHVIHNGSAYQGSPIQDDRQPLLCLHGFPEFWISWEEVMKELGDEYFMVIPDQRGCNKSDAPKGSENYAAKKLVADVMTLANLFFGRRKFNLAGHDFGASVAYALVFKFSEVINKFIIVNGAHPICLQEALIDDPAQAEASQYFHTLREDGAGIKSAANDFKIAFEIIIGDHTANWMTEEIKQRFRHAWDGAERLQAMFNWYKSSPIIVPVIGQPLPEAPLYGASRDNFRVTVPHLLIWGKNDTALLSEVRKSIAEFCDDLIIKEVENADHWILHTHAELVANSIRNFLSD
ncbi:MAG: alpha/beta fold hydrolase [Saprospiraceae bacterium]